MPPAQTSKGRTLRALRQYFVTGLVALLPVVVTVYIAYRIVVFFDQASALLPLTHPIPGLGLIITFVFITLFGMLVSNILGQSFVRIVEWSFERVPLVRSIYDGLKQIIGTFTRKQGEEGFKSVVLVPYPDPVSRAMGFVMNEDVAPGRVGVFIPFSPPTGGYLLFFNRDEVESSDLTVDAAMKLLISGGTIIPNGKVSQPKGEVLRR